MSNVKKTSSLFDKVISAFMRGAEGGGYGKWAAPLFLGIACLVAFTFAALFHFLGALGACATAAVLAALALAHFDAEESEQPAEPAEAEPLPATRRRKNNVIQFPKGKAI